MKRAKRMPVVGGGAGKAGGVGSGGDDSAVGVPGGDARVGDTRHDRIEGGIGGAVDDAGDGRGAVPGGPGADDRYGGGGDDPFPVSGEVGAGDTVCGGPGPKAHDATGARGSVVNPSGGGSGSVHVHTDAALTPRPGTPTFFDMEIIVTRLSESAMVPTVRGPPPVEQLPPGGRVPSCDTGLKPVAGVGTRAADADDLARAPALAPVRIVAGVLGAGQPDRDTRRSPRHRLRVTRSRSERPFHARDASARAASRRPAWDPSRPAGRRARCPLDVRRPRGGPRRRRLERSFQPGAFARGTVDAARRLELSALRPGPERDGLGRGRIATARRMLGRRGAVLPAVRGCRRGG
jgi:hypothetical protein